MAGTACAGLLVSDRVVSCAERAGTSLSKEGPNPKKKEQVVGAPGMHDKHVVN